MAGSDPGRRLEQKCLREKWRAGQELPPRTRQGRRASRDTSWAFLPGSGPDTVKSPLKAHCRLDVLWWEIRG